MEDGVVRCIDGVAAVHIASDQERVQPRPQDLHLVG